MDAPILVALRQELKTILDKMDSCRGLAEMYAGMLEDFRPIADAIQEQIDRIEKETEGE